MRPADRTPQKKPHQAVQAWGLVCLLSLALCGCASTIDHGEGYQTRRYLGWLEVLEHRRQQQINIERVQATGLRIGPDRIKILEGSAQALPQEVQHAKVDNIQAAITSNSNAGDLPTRLYIQIATEAQRPTYEAIAKSFQGIERVRVPSVEVVDIKAPTQSDLRYCPSTKQEVAQAVRQQIETVIGPVILRQLPETLCRTVRQNNIELWISKETK